MNIFIQHNFTSLFGIVDPEYLALVVGRYSQGRPRLLGVVNGDMWRDEDGRVEMAKNLTGEELERVVGGGVYLPASLPVFQEALDVQIKAYREEMAAIKAAIANNQVRIKSRSIAGKKPVGGRSSFPPITKKNLLNIVEIAQELLDQNKSTEGLRKLEGVQIGNTPEYMAEQMAALRLKIEQEKAQESEKEARRKAEQKAKPAASQRRGRQRQGYRKR